MSDIEENGIEENFEKIHGIEKSIRAYMDKMNYYFPPSYKNAVYRQIDSLMEEVIKILEEDEEAKKEMDISNFIKSCSSLESELSSMNYKPKDPKRESVSDSFGEILKYVRRIELEMKGFNVENLEGDGDSGEDTISPEEIEDMML